MPEPTNDGALVSKGRSDWNTFTSRTSRREDLEDKLEWIKFSRASFTHDGAGFSARYPKPRRRQTTNRPTISTQSIITS